jgi:hypothetical protein
VGWIHDIWMVEENSGVFDAGTIASVGKGGNLKRSI